MGIIINKIAGTEKKVRRVKKLVYTWRDYTHVICMKSGPLIWLTISSAWDRMPDQFAQKPHDITEIFSLHYVKKDLLFTFSKMTSDHVIFKKKRKKKPVKILPVNLQLLVKNSKHISQLLSLFQTNYQIYQFASGFILILELLHCFRDASLHSYILWNNDTYHGWAGRL